MLEDDAEGQTSNLNTKIKSTGQQKAPEETGRKKEGVDLGAHTALAWRTGKVSTRALALTEGPGHYFGLSEQEML